MLLKKHIDKLFILILAVICQTGAVAQSKTGTVSLEGILKNFNNQVEVEDMSDFQYLRPATGKKMIIPDSAGHFTTSFSLEAPAYFRVGRNQLYLSPGDNLHVFIDKANPNLATFQGKGEEANTYLRGTPFPKGGSFLEAGLLIKPEPAGTIEAIMKAAALRTAQLDSVKGITAAFRRLEKARIKADIINSLLAGNIYSAIRLKLKGDSAKAFSAKYNAAIQPALAKYSSQFVDASLMQLVVYRDIADTLLHEPGNAADKQKIKDWYEASELVNDMRKLSDKQALAASSSKIAAIKTPAYREAAAQTLASLLKFGKGDEARSFTATNLAGDKVNLQSLKGKVIYLDLWATWCGPCLAEMPHYEELKEKYKNNSQIVFVSLSIDDTEAPWKKNVESRKAEGIQWIVNRNMLTDYEVVGIPRTIVIDKNFKVADLNAPLPSDKKTIGLIDGLLQQN
ncbi:MAG: TlpA family protein disulfide reductase [Williamsia sp.]|nr:TlpA family protein disulfide reductase [Williamsia sp.]